jgi:hypothetical protein
MIMQILNWLASGAMEIVTPFAFCLAAGAVGCYASERHKRKMERERLSAGG